MTRRYLIIRNPVSGRVGRGVIRGVAALLAGRGIETEIENTRPGTAGDQARDGLARGFDAIIAAGGDGTIRQIAGGMLGSSRPLGLMPVGTANSLAREIGMGPGHSIEALAGYLAAAHTTAVRPGVVALEGREEIFLEEAGAGIDSLAVLGVTPRLKRTLGPAAYVLTSLYRLARGPNADLLVQAGGRRLRAGWFIAVRSDHYGGWLRLGSGASLTGDGLVLLVVRQSRRHEYFRYLWGLLGGRFASMEGVTLIRADEARISPGSSLPGQVPVPVQADGDLIGRAPFSIRLSDQYLNLITPAAM